VLSSGSRPGLLGCSWFVRVCVKGKQMSKNSKSKTHKGAKKRIRLSANGKLMRRRAFGSHLLTKKSANRKRKLRKAVEIEPQDANRLRHLLGR
jgi:large subunit ribosomal protein L35